VRDFQKNISVVPMSAKTGEGVSDLLLILVGLAQRFLEESLKIHAKGPGKGVILEIKEEKGLGITLDTIIYDGMIKEGDTIVVGGKDKPVVTKVKALLKPSPMTEIRVEKRFNRAKKVTAAAGIKISAPKLEDALAGSPIIVANDRVEEIKREMEEEISEVKIEAETDGIVIKADTIGSLDALIGELKEKDIPIRMADIGDISKRDIIEAETVKEELYSVLIGFNVNVLPNARQYLTKSEVKVFVDDVIYNLIDEYLEWFEEKRSAREKRKIEAITRPGRIELLPDFVFRSSKPAIVGVRVLAGSVKPGLALINDDGRYSGSIKQIQDKGKTIKVANKDMEVAMSIEDVTVGRQIKEGDILNVDIPEKHAKILEEEFYDSLSCEDADVFKILLDIKRKDNPFWAK
jgi:translation initiation factor 5B